MMTEYILVALLAIEIIRHEIDRRNHARQIREMSDRLQSGTLADYTAHKPEADTQRIKANVEETLDLEQVTRLDPTLAPEQIAAGQASFNRLMGDM